MPKVGYLINMIKTEIQTKTKKVGNVMSFADKMNSLLDKYTMVGEPIEIIRESEKAVLVEFTSSAYYRGRTWFPKSLTITGLFKFKKSGIHYFGIVAPNWMFEKKLDAGELKY